MGRGGGGGEGGGGRAALPDAHPALAAGSCGQPISIAFVLAFAAPYGPAPRSLCGACALQRLLPPLLVLVGRPPPKAAAVPLTLLFRFYQQPSFFFLSWENCFRLFGFSLSTAQLYAFLFFFQIFQVPATVAAASIWNAQRHSVVSWRTAFNGEDFLLSCYQVLSVRSK